MKPIKIAFAATLLLVTALWLLADGPLPEQLNYFSFRHLYVQFTGILAIALMSVAMLLALRLPRLEQALKGLDKVYRLHKWLGIAALGLAVVHWWLAQGTKWMVGWGWLSRPQRGGGHQGPELSGVEQWIRGQRGLAESLGEWAFYATAILITLALVKAFPYRWFRKTHTWLAPAYLVLVYHSLILTETDYWSQPVGWLLAALLLGGTLAGLLVLSGRVGRRRQVAGAMRSVKWYPGVRVVEGCIDLEPGWPGHRPGQFAFVTSKSSEGAHPYTIASAWNDEDPSLTFIVKSLGDWTGQLNDWLKPGLPVTVEGPYGSFDFEDDRPHQIWIGAGIGITPFIAMLKHLKRHPDGRPIDLFHSTADVDQSALDKLTADISAAGVRLHLTITPEDGYLTAEQIRAAVPEWRQASLWFCGPAEFGAALRKDFINAGMPAEHFHQELFEMR
ncbi:ferric reductase [Marinobacterium nitratireducens]|uniref:Ferric reductase n=1 Tax=Marinobacterium nitratireducens TaxID=518897 RepID=A0A917ZEL0_9GAMM|nr:ferric reductase-like transmembrane domain-containing protein [Marinobacterium nitratireducens]GGO80424.1 ferric reductase [Marinobacterium nitratireducens]